MLGLCQKAGKLKSGEFSTEAAVKDGSAWLVILAGDASDNTKKKFNDMCSFYEVDVIEYATKETLAQAIGKEERASLAVCDEGFATSIKKLSAQLENK
ncbi:MAG: ribosomal L7Ae/L30e/S12e/Gadd45 family protein [Lachnospiraceae bacterium]|nr:ribosomal L7Ae/L30e/S12e/Gadd45 family protein [Lachnospiraceae bacterium]